MLRLIVAAFGIVQLLLTLRLMLPFVGNVPEAVEPLMPAFIQITDLLIAPFSWIEIPGFGGGFPGFGGGQFDASVLPALIGWSVVELVVIGVLRVFGLGRSRSRGRDWEGEA